MLAKLYGVVLFQNQFMVWVSFELYPLATILQHIDANGDGASVFILGHKLNMFRMARKLLHLDHAVGWLGPTRALKSVANVDGRRHGSVVLDHGQQYTTVGESRCRICGSVPPA